jgi:hypothetical protein
MQPIEKRKSEAEEALQSADAGRLKRLFDESCKEIQILMDGVRVIMDNDGKLTRPSESAIEAMRDVSLAAIQLARDVTLKDS